jgi:flagellar FliJ protein
MGGKQFELEQVLKYRLEVERLRQQEFAVAKHSHDQASEQLQQEETEVQDLDQEFCHRQVELASIEEMRHYADYFARKREEIKKQRERVNELGTLMDEHRENLFDATKDKKILESLKEKRELEFRLAMDTKEQNFMDEIAIQKKSEDH